MVGGGQDNQATGTGSFVGGGGYDGFNVQGNLASGAASTVGGGLNNNAGYGYATVGGGQQNTASGSSATVGGGFGNHATDAFATVAGGYSSTAGGYAATVAGGFGNQATGTGSFVGGGGYDGYNVAGNLASGAASTVGGGLDNSANNNYATVGGGFGNHATYAFATVGGGESSTAGGYFATVAGGYDNQATGPGSVIGGGGFDGANYVGNTANGAASTVAGGYDNFADGSDSAVGGGSNNTASGVASTVGGGTQNIASNTFATVAGGSYNTAGGIASFAAGDGNTVNGNYSVALGAGGIVSDANAFLWCDGTRAGTSQGAHSFAALATGGVWFYTGPGVQGLHIAPSGSSWITPSDRNEKKNFHAVDTVALLDKLAAIPIQQWNYKWERDDDVPNIGPMAQDFKAAFYPGRDDKGISTLEFDGVELAAIQGLNKKLEQQRAELQAKQSEIDGLMRRLAALEATVQKVSDRLDESKAAPIPAANVRNQGGM
jgi:hypothetical protein